MNLTKIFILIPILSSFLAPAKLAPAQGYGAKTNITHRNLIINIITVVLIIAVIYYPIHRKTDYNFTFIMFNIVIFLLTFVIDKIKISMGAATVLRGYLSRI
ncbi:MAG: DUF4956 domain-containing protein [Bacteroidia bacterium]|nr:DUF4956 domain-containing protein [Bacteroidia bacterium]